MRTVPWTVETEIKDVWPEYITPCSERDEHDQIEVYSQGLRCKGIHYRHCDFSYLFSIKHSTPNGKY